MRIWIIQTGEQHRETDGKVKEWRSVSIARFAAGRGHEVTYLGSTFSHAEKNFRFDRTTSLQTDSGYTLTLLHSPISYSKNVSFARLRHQKDIAGSFVDFSDCAPKPDLIICSLPTIELVIVAEEYCRAKGIPLLVDIRDVWPDVYLTILPKFIRPFAKLLMNGLYQRLGKALSRTKGLTGVSEEYLKWGLTLAGKRRTGADCVFPIGSADVLADSCKELRESDFLKKFDVSDSDFVVVFVGIFGSSYDLDTVVKAGECLEDRGVKIVLVGDGDHRARLMRVARDSQVVVFTGWLDAEECGVLLRRANAGLAAYRESARQSLPNKVFEYMAAGMPIISSLKGEFAEILNRERIGYNYDAGDVQGLADRINQLRVGRECRLGMGERARVIFERDYHQPVIYESFVNWIEEFEHI
ncbi:MAG: glycosyltransferase [Verrucomicrobiota bacterium]|jgi:glycosyltransferase involved in cell wall biosynthesis|nr:glycosyltransferase [Verrucomicrobiota bacterium]